MVSKIIDNFIKTIKLICCMFDNLIDTKIILCKALQFVILVILYFSVVNKFTNAFCFNQ